MLSVVRRMWSCCSPYLTRALHWRAIAPASGSNRPHALFERWSADEARTELSRALVERSSSNGWRPRWPDRPGCAARDAAVRGLHIDTAERRAEPVPVGRLAHIGRDSAPRHVGDFGQGYATKGNIVRIRHSSKRGVSGKSHTCGIESGIFVRPQHHDGNSAVYEGVQL